MRIALHSDLHLEGYRVDQDFLVSTDYDVLILAGDIVSYRTAGNLANVVDRVGDDKLIVFTPGNHEYYHGDVADADLMYQETCDRLGIFYAKRDVVVFDDVAIVCATGWPTFQSYKQFDTKEKVAAALTIANDFRLVRGQTAVNMASRGWDDQEFIVSSLADLKRVMRATVVVTHFSPLEELNNPLFEVSPISAFFSNDCTDIVEAYSPDVWISGHTHYNHDVVLGTTRFVTNQRGYRGEDHCNNTYDANKIIEV